MDKIIHGDSLFVLKTIPTQSIDSVVTDPPYFLTNGSGSGFMGKEWDSLSVANAFAEAILKSLSPVWLTDAVGIVHETANINSKRKNSETYISALYVLPKSIAQNHKLSLGTFSVRESVLTKAEVLALSSALFPSLTSVVESQPENVLYVINNSFIQNCPNAIAQEVVLRLATNKLCEEIKILHTLMADQKTNDLIEVTNGKILGSKSTSATTTSVKSVESIVLEKRYNVTTLSLIESRKTIQWIISLRSVRDAMALFMAIPGNIQILSERFHYQWAKEIFRVLKPGGHILAFAGTRTYHSLAKAIESAGFEIRDQLQWIYGSGFPKSMDISKAIDKQAGAKREVLGVKKDADGRSRSSENWAESNADTTFRASKLSNNFVTAPSTLEAKQWQGFGTALKPANEPIVLARKKISEKTVASNVLKHGTGGLNIDESRIETEDDLNGGAYSNNRELSTNQVYGEYKRLSPDQFHQPQGRWPANILFDEEAAALLDEQSGNLKSGNPGVKRSGNNGAAYGAESRAPGTQMSGFGDSGGASRFFKVIKSEKHAKETECKTTHANNVELNSKTIQETAKEGLTSSVLKNAMQFLDSVSHSLNAKSAEKNAPNIELDFVLEVARMLNSQDLQLQPCLDYTLDSKNFILIQNLVSIAENLASTDITRTIQSLLKLCGSAQVVTASNTQDLASATELNLGPTRFLYQAKASKSERGKDNHHPTVKPIKLMKYLINLVTPPNGTVLDPFAGSGSTLLAAKELGFNFIGIELSEEYVEIAKKRVG